ncbi:DUF6798 domain-containing protein [Candidatus Margulisiibacteriota bacterium]
MPYTISIMNLKLNKLLLHTYLFFLSFFFLLFHGYHYGHWEQVFYIPRIRHLLDPSFLAQDWFISLAPYHAFALKLWGGLGQIFGLPWATAILYASVLLIYIWFTYFIAWELFKNKNIALLSAFLMTFIIPHGLGGSRMIQASLSPRMLGIALVLIALYFFFRGNYIGAFFMAFIAGKLHLLIGINILLILGLYYVFSWQARKPSFKELGFILLGLCFVLLPDIWQQIQIILGNPSLSPDLFIKINTQLRFPQHYLLLHTGPLGLFYFGALLCLLYFFRVVLPDKEKRAKFLYLAGILAVFSLINLLFVDLLHIGFLAKLQLLRLTYLIEYLFLLIFAAVLVDFYNKRPAIIFKPSLLLIIFLLPLLIYRLPENYKQLTVLLLILFIIFLLEYLLKKSPGLNTFRSQISIPALKLSFVSTLILCSILIFIVFYLLIFPQQLANIQCQAPGKNASAFIDIAYWAKMNTSPEAIFITPPHVAGFRLHAERAIITDFQACPYLENNSLEWKHRLDKLIDTDLFASGLKGWAFLPFLASKYYALSSEQISNIGQEFSADYLLTKNGHTVSFPLVYKNNEYALYKL